MKKVLCLTAIFIGGGILSSPAEPPPKPAWEVGAEISNITYKEPGIMKQEGTMVGLFTSYTFNRNNFKLRGEGRMSHGEVTYTGSLWDGTPLRQPNIPDFMFELRGLLGADTHLFGPSATSYVYTGLGYRYLNDNSSQFASGYERESNYYYMPIGLETVYQANINWTIAPAVEFDYFLSGFQISHLNDNNPGFNNLSNPQHSGYGYRASLRFLRHGQSADFAVEPFLRYWNIGQSEVKLITYYGTPFAYGIEPKNNSLEIGFKFVIHF